MENSNYPENDYSNSMVPNEIKKWNWGAFMYNMVWGIGNKSYITLLCLVPILNIIWPFVCGAKGNEWAWKNGNYSNTREFFLVQDTWNRAGFVTFIIAIIFIVIYVLFFAAIFSAILSGNRY